MEKVLKEIKQQMIELNHAWADGNIDNMKYIQVLNNLMQALLVNSNK